MTTMIHNEINHEDDKWVIWTTIIGVEDARAPYDDPTGNWTRVRFCDQFQYLNALTQNTATIAHSLVAGVAGSGYSAPSSAGGSGTGPITNGQIVIQDQTLYTHSLGYVPQFQVLIGNELISPGTVVQIDKTLGLIRYVSVYATTSIIGVRNVGISSASDLPSINVDYKINIFRQPTVIPGAPLVDLNVNSGNDLVMGHGRITSAQKPLRRTQVGDVATFFVPITRTMDVRDGCVRKINLADYYDHGNSIGYNGSLIQAQFLEMTYE